MSEEIVDELIAGRRAVYGDPEETFNQHAAVWSAFLGDQLVTPLRGDQIASLMMLYKLGRANHTPDYSDNIDDVIGYADIFKKVLGEDLIKARSVDEYLQIKANRKVVT